MRAARLRDGEPAVGGLTMPQIIFKVDRETGKVEMEAVGYTGTSCRDATKPFEDALGVVKDRTIKRVAWAANAPQVEKPQHIKMEGKS
jgi:hypothetical protein